MARPSLARRSFAEALATFALVFAGCGAVIADEARGGPIGGVGVALGGLVIPALGRRLHVEPIAATRHVEPNQASRDVEPVTARH